MIPSKIKCLDFSDVHLFHDKVKTEHILLGLYATLTDNARLQEVDIIFISGDLFDKSVALPNPDVYKAYEFINYLLNLCAKYDIVLRVLEGTPSHDWMQSKIIAEFNHMRPNPVDAKHVTTLSIEHMERFGIDVLYVPDEWGQGCESTFEEVKSLLIKHNLEKVDLSIMHGCFNFQFPSNMVGKPETHSENDYLSITRYLVIIGHFHTHSFFERIYVPGSFDRLKHGEEEQKGHLEFTLYKEGNFDIAFIPNPKAMVFRTFNFTGLEIDACMRVLDEFIKSQSSAKPMFIRIQANTDDAIFKGASDLRKVYPHVRFTTISNKKTEEAKVVSNTSDIIRPQSIGPLNIEELMIKRLTTNHPDKLKDCIDILRSVMKNE